MNQAKPGLLARIFRRKPKPQLAQQRPGPIADRVPRGEAWSFDQSIERSLTLRTTTGAAIEQITQAYQRAEQGWIEPMVDLFERRIEGDAHLRAALDNRNEAVSQKPWTIEPGGGADQTDDDRRAAIELERALRRVPNFTSTLEHQLTFNPYGFAGSEIIWDLTEDGIAAPVWFQDIAHRRFTFGLEDDRPMLRTTSDPIDGIPLTPGKWWFTCRRGRLTATSGLMRNCLWWSTWKLLAVRDWMIYAERFGLPYVTGQYDETISDDDKEVLRQAVRDLGSDGFAIFSDAAKIVLHEVASRGSDNTESVHAALSQLCDNEISFLIEGATLVSSVDGPGSHALGKVHQNRYFDILKGDSERLSQSFEHSVGLPFVKFNGMNARPPRLRMHLGLNLDVPEFVKMGIDLANGLEGFELDEEQIRTMTQFRKPMEGQGLRGAKFATATVPAAVGRPPSDEPEDEDEAEPEVETE